ncbi:MAG: hypothetical protein GY711_17515 [bacterium]|nr:hypothetical protein [bacterium]
MRQLALAGASCALTLLVATPAALAAQAGSRRPTEGLYAGRFDPDRHKRSEQDEDGGTPTESTRAALDQALHWLATAQSTDGSWPAPDRDGGSVMLNGTGLSGLALLAFLGAGNTHEVGPYKQVVAQGLRHLRSIQADDTGAFGERAGHTFLYNHGIATYALSEALRLTRDDELRDAAQAAVEFIESARNPYGAWRYDVPPIGDNDTSVTGWMILALKTAQKAGVEVDERAFADALDWIDEVTDVEGRVGYNSHGSKSSRIRGLNDQHPTEHAEAMTAVGLFARWTLGQRLQTSPIMEKHALRLLRVMPEWDPSGLGCDMYHWYFGTLGMRALDGDWWEAWEASMRQTLLPTQRTDGASRGSWDPIGPWGVIGGRVYSTALMALCLEAYWTVVPDPPIEIAARPLRAEADDFSHVPPLPPAAAARAGVRWLLGAQKDNGSWDSGDSKWKSPAPNNDIGATGLAVLALLGDDGASAEVKSGSVTRALTWLGTQQDKETGRIGRMVGHTFHYDHAIATLALSEASATRPQDERLRAVSQSAVDYILRARNPYGAWRYAYPPTRGNDTSVTGWMVRALASAKRIGLRVDEAAFEGASNWIDAVTDPATGRVGYDSIGSTSSRVTGVNDRVPTKIGEAMTAIGLYCRLMLGESVTERPVIMRHAELLLRKLPEWRRGEPVDMYYVYYGSLAMRQMGGKHWELWQHALHQAVLRHQNRGDERGSWSPVGPWGFAGGRVYATALMTLALQESTTGDEAVEER